VAVNYRITVKERKCERQRGRGEWRRKTNKQTKRKTEDP